MSLYRTINGDQFAGKSSLGEPCRKGIPIDELKKELDAYETVYRRAGPHPNLVNVYGIAMLPGKYGPQRTLLMDAISGKTGEEVFSGLRSAWQSDEISSAEYWSANQLIARRLLAVTAHLGKAGIVHNDIKPANFMVDASTGEPVVIDLGVACKQGSRALSGTSLYISPEALAGKSVNKSSDVLTVGATLLRGIEGPVALDAKKSVYTKGGKYPEHAWHRTSVAPNTGLRAVGHDSTIPQGLVIRQPGTYSPDTSYSRFMHTLVNQRSDSAAASEYPFLTDSILDDDAAKMVIAKVMARTDVDRELQAGVALQGVALQSCIFFPGFPDAPIPRLHAPCPATWHRKNRPHRYRHTLGIRLPDALSVAGRLSTGDD